MPVGAVIIEFFSGIADAWRARRALKAQADLQAGNDILKTAIREDAEMKAAVARQEAAKRLDADLSSTPIVPALPPAVAPAPVQPQPVQPSATPSVAPLQSSAQPVAAPAPVLALVPAAPEIAPATPSATPTVPREAPAAPASPALAGAPVAGVPAPLSN